MPSKANHFEIETIGLVLEIFTCNSSPGECMPVALNTIKACDARFVFSPGLGINDYIAMVYSPTRIQAANQIADALIKERRAVLGNRPQN